MTLLGEARRVQKKKMIKWPPKAVQEGWGSTWKKAKTGGATFEKPGRVKAYHTTKP